MPRAHQGVQRRNGKLRRAGETQPQRSLGGVQRAGGVGGAGRRRTARPHPNLAPAGPLLALLFQAPPNELSFEFGEVIDEQLALEMIHLMLDAHTQHALRVHLERHTVPIQCPHADMLGPLHFVVNVGQRQAPFLARTPSLRPEDFRIDEHHGPISFLAHVQNEHATMHVDLGGSKADALRGIHGFQKIGRQLTHRVIDDLDRLGRLPETGSGYSKIASLVMGVMRAVSCFRPKNVVKVPPAA